MHWPWFPGLLPVSCSPFQSIPTLLSILALPHSGTLCIPTPFPWVLLGSDLWGDGKQFRVKRGEAVLGWLFQLTLHPALPLSKELPLLARRCTPVLGYTGALWFPHLANSPLWHFSLNCPVRVWPLFLTGMLRVTSLVLSQLTSFHFTSWASTWVKKKKNQAPLPSFPYPTSKSCAGFYSCGRTFCAPLPHI